MMDQPFSHQNQSSIWRNQSLPLPKHSVYRSIKGRNELQAYYDRALSKLPDSAQTSIHPTSFGATHITCMGNRHGTPLLILPGMSTIGPIMLDFFAYLAKDHWLIAPDLIGQPGRSADSLFSPSNNAYGKWLIELLDDLGIEKIDVAGSSFGGSIGIELLKLAPERINKHALVVTAGLTPKIPYLKIYAKLLFSWLTYRFLPVKSLLSTIALPLSRHLTPDNLEYLDIVIRQTAFWRHRPAGPFFKQDMPSTMQPTLIVFSRDDVLFPFAKTRAHAHQVLNVGQEYVLTNSAHMPNDKEMAPIHKEIAAYFKL